MQAAQDRGDNVGIAFHNKNIQDIKEKIVELGRQESALSTTILQNTV
jgi:hypothetical protein